MTEETENLWRLVEKINKLIRFSDTKATTILAINGVIAGFFFAFRPSFCTSLL